MGFITSTARLYADICGVPWNQQVVKILLKMAKNISHELNTLCVSVLVLCSPVYKMEQVNTKILIQVLRITVIHVCTK